MYYTADSNRFMSSFAKGGFNNVDVHYPAIGENFT